MIRTSLALTVLATAAASAVAQRPAPKTGFTLEQVTSLPFPDALTAAATGRKLAWELNERGVRNVWVAEGPDFTARQLTPYSADDGQELTSISISADGKWVVYVRGGDHGANWEGPPPNPASLPVAPRVQMWSVPFAGGTPKLLADGDDPVISPKSDVVAFGSGGQISVMPVDGSAPAKKMIAAKGAIEDAQWSPDGSRLAFVSTRGDHAFIGVYAGEATPITWIAPTTSDEDQLPAVWGPAGRAVARGGGGDPGDRRRLAGVDADEGVVAAGGDERQP